MRTFVKTLLTVTALGIFLFPVAAYAGENMGSNISFPGGTFAINSHTCKFLHPEQDKPLGSTWAVGKVAFAYEDGRHDAKLNCLTNKVNGMKSGQPGPTGPTGPAGPTGARGPAGPAGAPGGLSGYVRVSVSINFKQASATATCPQGKNVLGGGATVEVSGSYPSSDHAWTVTRDNMWGHFKTGTAYAVCANVTS